MQFKDHFQCCLNSPIVQMVYATDGEATISAGHKASYGSPLNTFCIDISAFYLSMSGKRIHKENRSWGSLHSPRPGSHDAKNRKESCCVLLQAIRCYRLLSAAEEKDV